MSVNPKVARSGHYWKTQSSEYMIASIQQRLQEKGGEIVEKILKELGALQRMPSREALERAMFVVTIPPLDYEELSFHGSLWLFSHLTHGENKGLILLIEPAYEGRYAHITYANGKVEVAAGLQMELPERRIKAKKGRLERWLDSVRESLIKEAKAHYPNMAIPMVRFEQAAFSEGTLFRLAFVVTIEESNPSPLENKKLANYLFALWERISLILQTPKNP